MKIFDLLNPYPPKAVKTIPTHPKKSPQGTTMESTMVELGDLARDTVSGWEGVVTAEHRYLNGCVRFCLDSKDENGKPTGYVFDEQQVVVLEKGRLSPEPQTASLHTTPIRTAVGGPRDNGRIPQR